MDINKVFLVGSVGEDPHIQHFENDSVVIIFMLITDEKNYTITNESKLPNSTEWHLILLNNNIAKMVKNKLSKGMRVCVEGKLHYNTYDNNQGEKKNITEIWAYSLELLDLKKENPQNQKEAKKSSKNYTRSTYQKKTYNEFNGSYAQDVMGYDDDLINDAFEGDSDAYWNID